MKITEKEILSYIGYIIKKPNSSYLFFCSYFTMNFYFDNKVHCANCLFLTKMRECICDNHAYCRDDTLKFIVKKFPSLLLKDTFPC